MQCIYATHSILYIAHRIVRCHPETGRRSLYVGPHLTRYVADMKTEESAALLGELYQHLDSPRFVWTHQWQVGDLIMYDNRSCLHRATEYDIAKYPRILRRTNIADTKSTIPENTIGTTL